MSDDQISIMEGADIKCVESGRMFCLGRGGGWELYFFGHELRLAVLELFGCFHVIWSYLNVIALLIGPENSQKRVRKREWISVVRNKSFIDNKSIKMVGVSLDSQQYDSCHVTHFSRISIAIRIQKVINPGKHRACHIHRGIAPSRSTSFEKVAPVHRHLPNSAVIRSICSLSNHYLSYIINKVDHK